MTVSKIFDNTLCTLGEGPMWHPKRNSLIWFDILSMCMYERGLYDKKPNKFQFNHYVSACGWINEKEILIATSKSLDIFNFENRSLKSLIDLESENSLTRPNDGRTDPFGGFWISTMGIDNESEAGSIYRFYKGELRKLFSKISVPNSICFSPDGASGYFSDSSSHIIMAVRLDSNGWPISSPETFIDLRSEGLIPDGSVVDKQGCLWNAQWGSSRVAQYSPSGELLKTIKIDAPNSSCPEFGGENGSTIFVTSARCLLSKKELDTAPMSGAVFFAETSTAGQLPPRILLD